ncbi:MAG: mechanosensitive ion channel family protein [Ardenticatenaceae bacterium]|nr:mechanosensitive ion channel family protein [Anaerolineales bacterium]MCB8941635.1 mechanosensitive ion channel family protein [Ardenticatenaceae bacterium]MCB8974470.1 mechanosensitive ion channel family protein [Ardenticatenaceae bacterium]
MGMENFNEQAGIWLRSHGATILIIILVAVAAYYLLGITTKTLSRRIQALDDVEDSELDRRTKTIFRVVRSTGAVIIVGTAIMMILTELGVAITPVLASVGFVGLAFGLGAQTLVKDMIAGLFILIEDQYTVGDVAEIGGITGTVEHMTLRATEIRDLYGTVHIIPNGEIRIVANKSRDWSRAIVDVNVAYEEDVDTAVQALQEVGQLAETDEMIGLLLQETPVVTGVEGLEEWAMRLRLMVKTLPNGQWEVQRYLRRQIRLVFAQKGIELAFPRQELMIVPPKSQQN